MSSKERTLSFLEERRGEYVSGAEIASATGMTRAAVNKQVQALRKSGYEIIASPNRGYMLSASTDYISSSGIMRRLPEALQKTLHIEVLDETSSTNLLAREAGERGEASGYVAIARRQTQGRGRRGRRFFSDGGGVYMSLLLRRPCMTSRLAARYTTSAALAVCEAIEETSVLASFSDPDESGYKIPTPRIKWVNDVFLSGLKVGGVLTEGQVGLEEGTLEYAVVGIGVNLYPPEGGFPAELDGIAGSVFEKGFADGRNLFIAKLLERFMARCDNVESESDLAEYRRRLLAQGREGVVALPDGRSFQGKILGIDDDYRLIVELEDGRCETLLAGDVSVRPTAVDDVM